jgi:hypothetical protein
MAPHPLLKPRFWSLWSGSGGLHAVRAAAAAFWLAGAAMALAWMVALMHEAVVWGAHPVLLMVGFFSAVAWCWFAWSTWFTWRSDRPPITLLWAGPVREVEERGVVREVGGFRVVQWQAAVRVEVLADLQRWMLLRVRSQHVNDPRQAWLWLDAKAPRPQGATTISRNALHQLRSLLYQPSGLTTAQNVRPADRASLDCQPRSVMASRGHPLKSGGKLRSTVSPSAFPSTFVMGDEGRLESLTQRSGKRV